MTTPPLDLPAERARADAELAKPALAATRAARDARAIRALLDRVKRAESVYERVEQQALGAEANLESALKVSRERLTRAEAAEKNLAAVRELLDRWDTPELREERIHAGVTEGLQRLIDNTRTALDGGA